MIKYKTFILKWLMCSIVNDALRTDNHILADKIIILEDALKEVGFL